MNEERDVNQEQQTEEVVEDQQPSGLMAQEKQNTFYHYAFFCRVSYG